MVCIKIYRIIRPLPKRQSHYAKAIQKQPTYFSKTTPGTYGLEAKELVGGRGMKKKIIRI